MNNINKEEKKKEFKAFPPRHIRVSDEVWKKFKSKKARSEKTWNQFIKQLT